MAAIAGLAIVGIAAYLRMLVVHLPLLMFMATRTREIAVVTRYMAVRASERTVRPPVDGEIVVELCLRPCDVRWEMTSLTGREEPGRNMVGVASGVVIARVAPMAVCG